MKAIDLGLVLGRAGDGDGDCESRLKGLLCHLGPVVVDVDMAKSPFARRRVAG